MLDDSDFLKLGYTHTGGQRDTKENHFPLILSRIPFITLYNTDMKVVCLFSKNGINFLMVNVHLNSEEENREVRAQEFDELMQILLSLPESTSDLSLKSNIEDALQNKNVMLFGDLNMHFPGENSVLEQNGFYDLWLEQHSHFDGLTWDHKNNLMNHYKSIFDMRRLRLDRVCFLSQSRLRWVVST